VQLDTGSADLWITGSDCTTCGTGKDCSGTDCKVKCDASCCLDSGSALLNILKSKSPLEDSPCAKKNQYNGAKSSTYTNLNQPFSIQYGTGSCSGTYVQDKVCLGGICIQKQEFADANFLAKDFTDDNVDGICGMAFTSCSVGRVTPPFQNMIDEGLVSNPWFTMFLAAEGDTNNATGGYVTLGDYDTQHCSSQCNWVPLSLAYWYEFILQGVAVGTGSSANVIFKNTLTNAASITAISDTGTSFVVGPTSQIEAINKQLGGKLSLDYGGWVIDCAGKGLPPVVFTINGKDYPVYPANYIVYADKKTCILGFGVGGGQDPQWILGDTFIRQYCNVYDMSNKRVGLCATL